VETQINRGISAVVDCADAWLVALVDGDFGEIELIATTR
jgi:hypothetical protein